ncbi:MAG TPA: sulfite exporter TauE/SafE family protein [Kofleriaceae bacterium]|nr:sulfite exporter TauE/SafE family protein [Kofleriaceae bacterium]
MHSALDLALVAAAAFAAGLVNAIAGGGSLITFPALVAVGLSSVVASLTNTVALCPGYLGATIAQRKDLAGQRGRLVRILPFAALGGVAGAVLLLTTDERAFDVVVPFLILFAAILLAVQKRLQAWLGGRRHAQHGIALAALAVLLAAVYGGYFGAGLGVIVLAALAVVLADTLTRINAIKQSVSLVVNVSAAAVFLGSGRVDWPIAGVMLVASLAGGALGGMIASKIPAAVLRWLVVTLALAVAGVYFARW